MDRRPDTKLPLGARLGNGRRKRDTAEACRQRVQEDRLFAVNMPAGNERTLLERSAAAWGMLAEKLELAEAKLAALHPARTGACRCESVGSEKVLLK